MVRTPHKHTFVAGILLLALLPACDAGAARKPYRSEGRAISQAVGMPRSCVSILVSTVDRRWAAASTTNRPGCAVGDGKVVLRKGASGHWRARYTGPNDGSQPCRYIPELPARIARDLRVCR